MNGQPPTFARPPFADQPDAGMYFPAASHEHAAEQTAKGIARRAGLTVLTGEAGVGKTQLCKHLLAGSRIHGTPLLGTCRPGESAGLLVRIGRALKLPVDPATTPQDAAEAIRDYVLGHAYTSRPLVVVLDQAENLAPAHLDELVVLAGLGKRALRRLRIVLVGRPQLERTLAHPRFEPLADQVVETATIEPLGAHEAAGYVNHRLKMAGHAGPPLFDAQAIDRIARLCRGNPRQINRTCLAALELARAANCSMVTCAHIEGSAMSSNDPASPRDLRRPMASDRATSQPARAESAGVQVEEQITTLVEKLEAAASAVELIKAEVALAESAAKRIGSLTSALSDTTRRAATGAAEAGRATEKLLAAVSDGRVAVEVVELRTKPQLADAAERIAQLTDAVTAADAVRQTIEQQVDRAEQAAARAANVRDELTRHAGGLTDLNAQTEERIAAVSERLQAGERFSEELKRLTGDLASASQAAMEAEQAALQHHAEQITALIERLEAARGAALDVSEQTLRQLRDETRQLADDQQRILESTITEAQSRGEALAHEVEGLLDRCAASLETLHREVEAAEGETRQLAATVAEVRDTHSGVIADVSTSLEHLRQEVADGRAAAEGIERRIQAGKLELSDETERLSRRLGEASATVERVQHAVATGQTMAQDAERRFEAGRAQLAAQTEHLHRLVTEAAATTDRVRAVVTEANAAAEDVERSLEAGEAQLSAGTERLNRLLSEATSTADRAQTAMDAGQSLADDVERSVQRGREQLSAGTERLNRLLSEATSTADRVQTAVDAGQSLADDVERSVQTGREQLSAGTERLNRLLSEATSTADRVETAMDAGQSLADGVERSVQRGREQLSAGTERLNRLLSEATSTADRVQTVVVDSRGAAERVESSLSRQVGAAQSQNQRLADLLTQAAAAANGIREEVEQVADANTKVASLVHRVNELADEVESARTEVGTAVVHLRGILADGQTAAAAIEHRVRLNVADGREVAETLTAAVADSHAAAETLLATIRTAEGTLEQAPSVADALRRAKDEAATSVSQVHGATDRLRAALADTHAGSEAIRHKVETCAVQVNDAIDNGLRNVREATAQGQVAAASVERRMETAVALADREAENLEARSATAGEVSARLDGQLESSDAACRELAKLIGHVEGLVATAGDSARQCSDQTNRMAAARIKLDQSAAEAAGMFERLTAETPGLAQLMCKLDERVGQLTNLDAELASRVATAREVEARCHEQSVEAGDAVGALTDLIKQAGGVSQRIADAGEAADQAARRVAEQREAARATIERQQTIRDKQLALKDLMEQQTAQAENLAGRLAESCEAAAHARDDLAQRADRAAQVLFQLGEHIQAADTRREVLGASEQALREFVDQAESIGRQLQRIQAQADSFEVRINQLLDKPGEIAVEAKAQAAQLQGVCRAVRKVFGGLSEASLQVQRQVEEYRQASQAAEARTTRLNAETNRAAETLRAWVEEAVRAQARLASYLDRCPAVQQTHPADSLRGLSTTFAQQAKPPAARSQRLETVGPAKSLRRTGVANPSANHPARAAERTEEVARLLQEAEKFAEATR